MPPELRVPVGLTHRVFRAMGTEVSTVLPARDRHAALQVRALVRGWERTLSRFDPASELSRVNGGETTHAGPVLADALRSALMAAWWTDGLYDPCLGAQVAAAGYDRTFGEIAAEGGAPAPAGPPVPGGAWRGVRLDDTGLIDLPAGARIDLGGIAKGLAVDASVALLRRSGVEHGLVSAGGDLAVWGDGPARGGWPIALRELEGAPVVPLRRGAMATSGTGRRRWVRDGRVAHHVIDPRTGAPAATDLRAVSVVAERCGQAEAAATAALVLGREAGAAFLRAKGMDGLLVPEDGDPVPVGAWPAPRREVTV